MGVGEQAWLPDEEAICRSLAGFRSRTVRVPAVRRRAEPRDLPIWRALALLGAAGAVVGAIIAYGEQRPRDAEDCQQVALFCLLWLLADWFKRRTAPPKRRMTKWLAHADAEAFTLRSSKGVHRVRWADVVGLEWLSTGLAIHVAGGRVVSMPQHEALAPIERTLNLVVDARVAHEEATMAAMERGLSRPESNATFDRGLSLVDDETTVDA